MMRYYHLRLAAASTLVLAVLAVAGSTAQPPTDVVAVLKGHTDTIDAVAVSPDGTLIATGSFDQTIRLWNAAAGTEVRVYGGPKGHKGQVLSVAFNAAGDSLASGATDNTAKVWDLPVSFANQSFSTSGPLNTVAVTTDGKSFAVAGADGVIKIFPQGEAKGAIELKGHTGAVLGLGYTTNNLLLSAGADRTVRVWAANDGKPIAAFRTGTVDLTGFAVNPNGSMAFTRNASGEVQFWPIPVPATKLAAPFQSLCLGGALVLEVEAKKPGAVLPGMPIRSIPVGAGKGVFASPGSDRLLTPVGKEIVSWNAGNGMKEKAFEAGGEAATATLTKDGQRVAVGGSDGTIKLYGFADGKLLGSFPAGAPALDLAFHPKDPVLVGVLNNKTVAVWDVSATPGQPVPPEFGKPLQTFPHPENASAAAFLGDGQFITTAADKQARRFRIASSEPVKSLQHPNLVDSVAWDATGNLLATGCHDGNLRIWDVAKGQPLKTIAAHIQTQPQNVQHPIYSVVWTPDSKQILTASYDGSMKLWDAASGNLVREFKAAPDPKPGEKVDPKALVGHRDQVFSAAFSKDGKLLASGSSDRSVKLWDVGSGKVIRDFANPELSPVLPGEPAPSHPGWVMAVRFSPDDKQLVSAGPAPRYRGYLAVWSVTDGKRLSGAERDQGPIQALAITADGSKLILGCASRTRLETDAEAVIIKMPGK